MKINTPKEMQGLKGKPMQSSYRSSMEYDKGEAVPELSNKVGFNGIGVSLGLDKNIDNRIAYKEEMSDLLQAGFIDINQSNNVFYSDTTAADLMPQPEDFVLVPFRLLSATIVAGGTWRATNFGHRPNALKTSVKNLTNKPVYYDHNTQLMNWVGLVLDPTWEEARKATGVKIPKNRNEDQWNGVIPAGINGTIAIDAKTNPKLGRGVAMGTVFSNSVTVLFDWEPSHKFEDEWSFVEALGTIGEDGKMVTRNVTKILDYYESSLVWLGADPFAKALDSSGQLVNIDQASIVPFSKDEKVSEYIVGDKISTEVLINADSSLSLRRAESFQYVPKGKTQKLSKKKKEKMDPMDNISLTVIANFLALPTEEVAKLTQDELTSRLTELSIPTGHTTIKQATFDSLTATQNAVDALEGGISGLQDINKDLMAQLTAAKPAMEFLQNEENELRDATIKANIAANDGTADPAFEKLVNGADFEGLTALYKQATGQKYERFKAECKECGSGSLDFKKSTATDPSKSTKNTVEFADDFDHYHAKFRG